MTKGMPGRTWVIAPDVEPLEQRWHAFIVAPHHEQDVLFHPHLRGGKPGGISTCEKLSRKPYQVIPERPGEPAFSYQAVSQDIWRSDRVASSKTKRKLLPQSNCLLPDPRLMVWLCSNIRATFIVSPSSVKA
jgi:hypothetical protein